MAYAIHLNEGTEEEVKKLLQQADGWIQMMGEDRYKAEGKLQDGNEFEESTVDSNIEIIIELVRCVTYVGDLCCVV